MSEIEDSQKVNAGSDSQFERERFTRRQALRKFGITSAMTAFAMFSIDDLARMVGNELRRRSGDNRIAEQIGREFQGAGVAFAGPPPYYGTINCDPNGAGVSVAGYCASKNYGAYGSTAYCSECCGGVFRNACASTSGVTWPPGDTCPPLGDDNLYLDGALCMQNCTGVNGKCAGGYG